MNAPSPLDTLHRLLDHFEARIDLAHVARLRARERAALRFEPVEALPLACQAPPGDCPFPRDPYPEAFEDPAKMMVNELIGGFGSNYWALERRDDAPLCIRANLGVGIVASMFGANVRLLENHMPWVEPFGDESRLDAIGRETLPKVRSGLGALAAEHYAFFRKTLEGYPKCREAIHVTLPDLQGPFSVTELLWGSEIYVALKTEPERLAPIMAKVTAQIAATHRFLAPLVNDPLGEGLHHQHGVAVRGNLLIRNDSITMLSPATYRDVVLPHDRRLAAEVGGAGVHFCGNGAHQVDALLSATEVTSIDFGQSWMQDVDAIYAKAIPRRVPLLRLALPREEMVAERVRDRFPTGANLVFHAASEAEAREVRRRYAK